MQSSKLNSQITPDFIWINYVGTFGKFQKWLTVYMWLIIGPLMAFNMTTQLLILVIPPHHCDYDMFTDGLSTVTSINDRNFIPKSDNETFDSCVMYQNIHFNASELNAKTIYCPNGWKYNYRLIYATPVSENSWVCKQAWKVYFIHSMYWAASAIGVIIFGFISDYYGRVLATKIVFSMAGIAGIASVFASKNFYSFLIFRMLVGCCAYQGIIPLIHVTEFVEIKKRLLVSIGYFSSMSLTSGLLPWFAYLTGNWRLLTLITSSAMFLVPIILIFMPESVRWLMAKGEINKAKKNIQMVANFNGQVTCGYILDNIQFFATPTEPLKRIFYYKNFLKLFFLTCISWFLVSLAFIGTNVFSSTLSKHPFFMITVNSLIDIIASVIAGRVADEYGRKKVACYNCLLSFIFFSTTIFFKRDSKLFLISFFLARLTLMVVFNIKLLYGAEVYPTAIRNRAVSVRMAVGSIGCFVSPLIVGVHLLNHTFSLLVFGVCTAMSGVIMIFLPETKDRQLPQTLQETEFNNSRQSS